MSNVAPLKALSLLEEETWDDLILKVKCYRLLSDYTNALKYAVNATSLKPDSVDSWLAAGWSAFDMGNFEKSNDFFDSAMGCDMYCLDALIGKALVLEKLGRDNTLYNNALSEIDPNLVI